MSTFPVASVQRLKEIAAEVIAGNTTWLNASVEVGLHVFTILAWLLGPQELVDDESCDEAIAELRALTDELMLPQVAPAGIGGGVLVRMLVSQIIQYLVTQLQNPEVWKQILEKLNEILNGNNGGGVNV